MILLNINGERTVLRSGDSAEIKEVKDVCSQFLCPLLHSHTNKYFLSFSRPQESGESQRIELEEWPGQYSAELEFNDENDAYVAAELAGGALGFDIQQSGTTFPMIFRYVQAHP